MDGEPEPVVDRDSEARGEAEPEELPVEVRETEMLRVAELRTVGEPDVEAEKLLLKLPLLLRDASGDALDVALPLRVPGALPLSWVALALCVALLEGEPEGDADPVPLRDSRALRLPVGLAVDEYVGTPTLAVGVALSEKLPLTPPVRVGVLVGKVGKGVPEAEPLVLIRPLVVVPLPLRVWAAVGVMLGQPVEEGEPVTLSVASDVDVPRLGLTVGV